MHYPYKKNTAAAEVLHRFNEVGNLSVWCESSNLMKCWASTFTGVDTELNVSTGEVHIGGVRVLLLSS